eukprot:g12650.t1
MEPYVREKTGKFPLSLLAEETNKGVGITGASVPSRALLGLRALYAAVNVNRRQRARCSSSVGGAPPSGSRADAVSAVSVPATPVGGAGHGGVTGGNGSSKKQQGRGGVGDEGRGGVFLRSVPLAPPPPPPPSIRVSAESFAMTPLLGHRYKYISIIGTGRFSDVIRAEDTFRPGRSVAIKVINGDCGAVAVREVRFMRFLGSVPNADFCPVVKLLDVLTYRGHYCLVTELFDGTLSFQESGRDAYRPEDGEAAAAPGPGPAMTLDYARGCTGPARGSASGLYDQGMLMGDRRVGGLQRRGFPAEPGSRLGPAALGGDGVGRGGCRGASGSPSSCSSRPDTTGESRSARSASPRSPPSPSHSPSPSPGEGCPAQVIRHVALQLVSALLLLRNHGLIHADIKPENVVVRVEERGRAGPEAAGAERGRRLFPAERVGLWDLVRGRALMGGVESLTVRLGDFGNAIHNSEAYLYYGDFEIQTLAYRAPEVLMGCPFGPAVDTWSVGVILLELLIGRPVFDTARSRAALLQQMVCALGPMPLRRFRVGHFFSEYYTQDQSLKVGAATSSPSDRHAGKGCCSCCWIANKLSVDVGWGQQTNLNRAALGSYCDGCCANRCRRPGRRSEGTAGVASQNPRLLSLLAGLLRFDPDERLTPLQALAHPFFGEALPFAALPQPRQMAVAAEHSIKAPPVEPAAATSRGKERGEGGPAAASAQHGNLASAKAPAAGATQAPQSLARLSSHLQEPSPSPCCNGSAGAGMPANREAVSTGTSRPHGGSKRSLGVPGVAAAAPPAARLSLPSLPAAASGNGDGTPNPSREVGSSSTSSSSKASREMDPTAQLRRLAEMAGAMVSNGGNRYTAPPLPSPRRNPFLNAELLAGLKREDPPADARKTGVSRGPPGREKQQQQQQQQQANNNSSKTPPARQRRPNPFVTPATLALLNPDLGVRKEAGAAAAAAIATPTAVAVAATNEGERGPAAVEQLGWDGRRAATATATATAAMAIKPATRKHPAKRDKVAPSPTRTATRAVATAQQKPHRGGMRKEEGKREKQDPTRCEKRELGTPTTTKCKRARRSPRAADNNSQGATPSRAREGGRTTTPRRAAVAAGAAILRLRDDDESSDGSLTL